MKGMVYPGQNPKKLDPVVRLESETGCYTQPVVCRFEVNVTVGG